jgi:hypothetical protein
MILLHGGSDVLSLPVADSSSVRASWCNLDSYPSRVTRARPSCAGRDEPEGGTLARIFGSPIFGSAWRVLAKTAVFWSEGSRSLAPSSAVSDSSDPTEHCSSGAPIKTPGHLKVATMISTPSRRLSRPLDGAAARAAATPSCVRAADALAGFPGRPRWLNSLFLRNSVAELVRQRPCIWSKLSSTISSDSEARRPNGTWTQIPRRFAG